MITIFNRKELCVTYDKSEQVRIRNILNDHNIDYSIKTINRTSTSPIAAGGRSRAGNFGQKQDYMYEYMIYVQKNDYEKAAGLVRK